ncbi:MAG TPA: hypothetical protein VM077_01700 [Candidatus Limnocylindrales bacterium]|nr:hypothetical protein [Candidatus Limnocylindrales bacterium]
MKFLKTRNGKIAAGVVAVLLLVTGYLLFVGKPKVKEESVVEDLTVQTISAEELGLTLTVKPDGKAVKFEITKLNGIKSLEYELTYEADSTAQEQGEGGEPRVQRGITGDAKVESGKSTYESEWLDLGSCSKNVCRYDSGVKSVSLTLKLNKDGGKILQSEKTLKLE